jgi:hypothetical protein
MLFNAIRSVGDVTNSANKHSPSFFYDKDWANGLTRCSIEFLKEGAKSEGFWLWNQRLAAVLIFKRELLEHGYTWQASRIDNHIHRLQPRKADLEREERRPL